MHAAQIVACTDGPLLVRGDFELVSSSGEAVERTRGTVALCRCGASAIKPFCDGTHKLVGFRTEPAPPDPEGDAA
ncbi:CDGSH iron-sulfur domain-containing protein [Agrococcus sp. HG114]|uniref:CDGSH iron-sulfur domain-containing protein n=1 Tax=Agrococcus sp. HG114 TaxID=2969757 RepID=UPI00215ABD48|nr:CDGSH iron-sulfur domain-containing protein [Agrococcus sp. HG114]MCR8670008.1 CDGSH iron-sulfur domain-containing protein [Agrococcus sp. HG114]